MLVRSGIVLWLVGGCGYTPLDPEGTRFKCDPQNKCPADHFCSNSSSGVCVKSGTLGCRDQPLTHYWGFDDAASKSGWEFNISKDPGGPTGHELVWTRDVGDPELGALHLQLYGDVPVYRKLGWIRYFSPTGFGDLRGTVFSVRVFSDKPARMKVYVAQDEKGTGWGDGGLSFLVVDDWDCVSLNLDNPNYKAAGYDASQVNVVGFELWGTSPLDIVIDDVGY